MKRRVFSEKERNLRKKIEKEREYLKCDTWEEMAEVLGALADK